MYVAEEYNRKPEVLHFNAEKEPIIRKVTIGVAGIACCGRLTRVY